MDRHFQLIKATFRSFDAKKQLLALFLMVVAIIGILGILVTLNNGVLVDVPAAGGSLTEGIIGTPRFVNPLLAVSDADRDLSALVYSGLMRMDENGRLIPDLADSYTISEDGLTYTFTLKRGLTWSDGKPVTTDDIVFTVTKAQDPQIKSTRRASWEGVTVSKINDREIRFELKQAYATFLDITTMGIVPKHLWQNSTPDNFALNELNLRAIGSGPYKIKTVKKNADGVPLYYELEPFADFALGKPKLDKITLRFYSNEEALVAAKHKNEIDSLAAISPTSAKSLEIGGEQVITAPLPRVFAVFFNQNEAPIFLNKEVRKALSIVTPRTRIIEEVLKGYGTAIDGPLPPGALGYTPADNNPINLEAAAKTLEDAGWKKGTDGIWAKTDKKTKAKTRLAFRITTAGSPELKAAAEIVTSAWRAFGADVTLDVFEIGDLNQNVIRPRKYEALLFGEVVGANPDPFVFWHSSQRLDPGLNISLYANSVVDKLTTEARSITNETDRGNKLAELAEEIKSDIPATFIYAPAFVYVIPANIQGISLNGMTVPADRFTNIYHWYTATEKVWPFFSPK